MRPTSRDMTYRQRPQQTRPRVPGLRDIENLTDAEKTARITMIADDVISAITQIAEMKDSGVLRDRNTRRIDDMIDTFGRTDSSHRRELEHLLEKRERSLRILRWQHKDELDNVVKSASLGLARLRRRTQYLEEELRGTKKDLADREMQYLAAVARNERTELVGDGKDEDSRRKRVSRDEETGRKSIFHPLRPENPVPILRGN